MSTKRRQLVVVTGLALFLGACGGSNESHAPPALNRDLIVGKWQAVESEQVIQSYEFAADNSIVMTFWHRAEPVKGTYSWSGDNKITVEYQLPDETKKSCQEVLANYRQHLKDRAKSGGGQYAEQIGNSANRWTDELLDTQVYRVGISEGANAILVLHSEKDLEFQFKKPK